MAAGEGAGARGRALGGASARFRRKRGAREASALAWPIRRPRDLLLLALALPQIWLWTALRALEPLSSAGSLVFYAGEAVGLIAALAWGLARPSAGVGRPQARAPLALDVSAALAMAAVPAALSWALLPGGHAAAGLCAAAVGGASLAWAYLEYFRAASALGLARSAQMVLLSFAAVPVLRVPLDLLPVNAASIVAAALPPLFLAAVRSIDRLSAADAWGEGAGEAGAVAASGAPGALAEGVRLAPFMIELAMLGFVLGLFRADADGLYGSSAYALLNMAIKTVFPLAMLAAARRLWRRVSIGTLCQVAVVFVAVSLATAANFPDMPAVSFVVFDYSRYVVVVSVFLATMALAARSDRHPCVVFAAGMGAYELALCAGLAARLACSLTGAPPTAAVLDAVCALLVVTEVSQRWASSADVGLFADGSPQERPLQPTEQIDAACAAMAGRYGLSPRELETMQLICKGRSKRYIAEQLSLSENTVRGYAKTLYSKLGVHSRQELLTLLGIE